jgi:Ca2+-binding RTX toxin-like protein
LVESANQGTDEVRSSVSITLGTNFENLTLTGTAAINGQGNNADNVMTGNAGNNVLNGRGGIDTLQMTREATFTGVTVVDLTNGAATGHGTDMLLNIENVRGTALSDRITGSAGNNVIDGADGNDEIFATAGVDHYEGGSGHDVLRFQTTGAATVNLAAGSYSLASGGQGTLAGLEQVVGSMHADGLTGDGNANVLSGGLGGDLLVGGGGDDALWGGGGSDRLVADAGSDTLTGHRDLGGQGHDASGDIFEVRPTAANVTVTDFQTGVDKLDLSAFGFNASGHSADWTASAAYTGNAGQDTLLQLTHTLGQVVSIALQGVDASDGLSLADFIGGSASLLPTVPAAPVNGGNGLADVFIIDPQNILGNHGGELDIIGFEDGLDQVDLSPLNMTTSTYWGGWFYDYGPTDQTRLEFWGSQGEFFAVNLVGHSYFQADATDFIM